MTEADRRRLLDWFAQHQRDLPWRRTRDPYAIWVSEIMLQQTQVATVIPYWQRWMTRFPTVEVLAESDEQDVLSLWQGLGYYRRCQMLLEGARWVVQHGQPSTAEQWAQVPGVGRYTAGAIASIAFGEPTPLVDGNVERVFARLTAYDETGSSLGRLAWRWATDNVELDDPGAWNQALMELGATICRPKAPLCPECPVADRCLALKQGLQEDLPRKKPARQVVELEQHIVVPISEAGRYGVSQIPKDQWWAGMWEFPRADFAASLPWSGDPVGIVRHQVTHHRIALRVNVAHEVEEVSSLTWLTAVELEALPMPAPQRKALRLAVQPRLL